jgi:alpha-amylase/alpha-mannosidase (GH57 family)
MDRGEGKVLALILVWHLHQPYYRDVFTKKCKFPWVRLHAIKDYYDMAEMVEKFPTVKCIFNITPSLMIQLIEYGRENLSDDFIEVTLKPANELNEEDKIFILKNFFLANPETMIRPNQRYNELYNKRGKFFSIEKYPSIKEQFEEQDYRDLQVWFNLSWYDPYWKTHDKEIKMLYEKGRNFSEEDKHIVIKKQREICNKVLSKYKELQDKEQIEVITSPFYHPIMPLLINSENAKKSSPYINLEIHFELYEDAVRQLEKAIDCYYRVFGCNPIGIWPSEQSVSEEVLSLLVKYGIRWTITDEEILYRSIMSKRIPTKSLIYTVGNYRKGDTNINILFRDHTLSDLIGFVYHSWQPQDAVNNLISSLEDIYKNVRVVYPTPVVTIALDGENCWEYYPNDGHEFLNKLYSAIASHGIVRTYTMRDILSNRLKNINFLSLETLHPGSWINANFDIWIAHQEDQLAWKCLVDARKKLKEFENLHPEKKKELSLANECIYINEGSDWYWWFGDEFSSPQDEVFDEMFRKNLINIYESINEKPPQQLLLPIKGKWKRKTWTEPIGLISPKIDGTMNDFFEWYLGGVYNVEQPHGVMYKSEQFIKAIHFGYDLDNLYIGVETTENVEKLYDEGLSLKIVFLIPENHIIEIPVAREVERAEVYKLLSNSNRDVIGVAHVGIKEIIEVGVKFDLLNIEPTKNVEFVVVSEKNGIEFERHPVYSSITLKRPSKKHLLENWYV